MLRSAMVCTLMLVACGGDDSIGLTITSPSPGASFERITLDAVGSLAAAVPMTVEVAGVPMRVAVSVAGAELAELDAEGTAIASITPPGPATLVVTAFDAGGIEAATAQVDVVIVDPPIASCREWLDLYGVPYTVGPVRPGVEDPVTSMMPINGIPYRSGGTLRTAMFGDCSLIKSLAEAAPFFRSRNIVEVTDLGVYNYRCIGSVGTPPNCPNGVSQHAYGNAIDIASVKDADGASYSVNNDWIIDPGTEKTCAAATEPGKDAFLHELICALKSAKVWNIVLTPNYNADHRDHFHVDLKAGSDFIERVTVGH